MALSCPNAVVDGSLPNLYIISCPTTNTIEYWPATSEVWGGEVSVDDNIVGGSASDQFNISKTNTKWVWFTGSCKGKKVLSTISDNIESNSVEVVISRYNWADDVIIPEDLDLWAFEGDIGSGGVLEGECEARGLRWWGDEGDEEEADEYDLH